LPKPVIVIVGPTASGKTELAVKLAAMVDGEIISADSMQLYKYMDIGTAKPDAAEMSGIRHYLISEVTPDTEFSVARFRELALKYISEILDRGRQPIVAGGTGLYVNSLIYNINFSETVSDPELRDRLKREALERGNRYLYERLVEIDPEAASGIHENDLKRIIRAIEVHEHTGRPISLHRQLSRLEPPPYRYLVFGLRWDREKLYKRIERRVDLMFERGLLDEVRGLVGMGYDKYAVAMQGLGYKEILAYLRGECTLEEAVYILKRDTRRYAKRQMTWFRRIEGIQWLDIDENTDMEKQAKKVADRIA
jgi:tRNA dimethylallyltransferase